MTKNITGHFAAGSCSSFLVDFGLIVHNLFICSLLALILRKGCSDQKKNVVSLLFVPVRIKGVQLTRTNLDFIFSGKNLFLSIRLIQDFANRSLKKRYFYCKYRNKNWEFVSAAAHEKHLFCEFVVSSCCRWILLLA